MSEVLSKQPVMRTRTAKHVPTSDDHAPAVDAIDFEQPGSAAGFRSFISNAWKRIAEKVVSKQPPPSKVQLDAHREFLDKRTRIAMLVGTLAYSLNVVEPWFTFHDVTA